MGDHVRGREGKVRVRVSEVPRLHIGVDIGGTFTDFVVHDSVEGSLRTFKILSTPSDPAQAVLKGLHVIPQEYSRTLVHGSTVATNALLERKGAKTAFVTTRGFRDLLTIGRQTRDGLYALFPIRPQPLIDDSCCLEVTERVDHCGTVLVSLDLRELPHLIDKLLQCQVEAVAISLLFSFANPSHESWLGQQLRTQGWFVSTSHELIPEFREYERTSTTVVNAYVSPILDRYLGRLAENLKPEEFHVLQSNGGRLQVSEARSQGVRSILSGPAGGVVGATHIAKLAGFHQIITFDMGGTSTDVSLVKDHIDVTNEAIIGGMPIRVPVIDIHTIGAGGGSIAMKAEGGRLQVGPESAGADPGPVCYGRGGKRLTVSDANLLLGRFPDEGFLEGRIRFDYDAAEAASNQLAQDLGLSPKIGLNLGQTMAKGIIDVVNVQMAQALRLISIERGHDPRDCVLISFGGAGGLHASELARSVGIPRVVVPNMASTLSAFGMLVADMTLDYSQTVMCSGSPTFEELESLFTPLVERGQADLGKQGWEGMSMVILRELDLRYVGQSFELTLPLTTLFRQEFDRKHEERYGYALRDEPIEVVTIRVRAIGQTMTPPLPTASYQGSDAQKAWCNNRHNVVGDRLLDVPFYEGTQLQPGNVIEGPAVILQPDTTTFLAEGDQAHMDVYRNLLIEISTTSPEEGP